MLTQVTVRGRIAKEVVCERCGTSYFYALERMAEGSAVGVFGSEAAQRKAEEEASRLLERRLASAIEVAPCIKCGHIQRAMVRMAQAQRLRWLALAGLSALAFGVVLAIVNLTDEAGFLPWAPVAVVLAVGAGLYGAYVAMRRFHDPNATPLEKRLELARRMAVVRPPGM